MAPQKLQSRGSSLPGWDLITLRSAECLDTWLLWRRLSLKHTDLGRDRKLRLRYTNGHISAERWQAAYLLPLLTQGLCLLNASWVTFSEPSQRKSISVNISQGTIKGFAKCQMPGLPVPSWVSPEEEDIPLWHHLFPADRHWSISAAGSVKTLTLTVFQIRCWGWVTSVGRQALDAWPSLEGWKLEGPPETRPGGNEGPCLLPTSSGWGNSARDSYTVCRCVRSPPSPPCHLNSQSPHDKISSWRSMSPLVLPLCRSQ